MKRALIASLLALTPLVNLPAQQPQLSQPTVQQQFDAASAALLAERWEEALRLFEAVEARLTSNRRTLAIVRVRKASALIRLDRPEEAAAALRAGLPDLPANDATLHEDIFLGLIALGELAELSLDYAEARRHYRAAKALPVPLPLRLGVYRGLIQTEMFEDAPAALANVDEALALARSAATGAQHEGLLRTLRGRTLLNMGRTSEARTELRTAMQRLGGMTTRVNRADIVARSDLAIAALLDGDEEDARRYLAFTGAGHYETRLAPGGGRMQPPRCGNGIDPADVAVLEYSIREDGGLGHVTPVYSSRQGAVALAFARAALGWSWDPQMFGDIPPLVRTAMRVELRCTQSTRNERILPLDSDEVLRWASGKGIDLNDSLGTDPRASPSQLRRELAARERTAEVQPARLLETLINLAAHPSVGSAETAGYLRRAIPIAVAEGAPPTLIASLAAHLAASEHRERGRVRGNEPPSFAGAYSLPAVRSDARATAAARLQQARMLYRWRRDDQVTELLGQVLATPGLGPGDPIVVEARQLQSALAASRSDWATARAAFEAIGPNAEACAIEPRRRSMGTSSSDFPRDAIRWGFEGWATVQSSLARDGSITGGRTIMSYPPFVFGEAAERITARARFEPVYLPAGAACRPVNTTVQFQIAN